MATSPCSALALAALLQAPPGSPLAGAPQVESLAALRARVVRDSADGRAWLLLGRAYLRLVDGAHGPPDRALQDSAWARAALDTAEGALARAAGLLDAGGPTPESDSARVRGAGHGRRTAGVGPGPPGPEAAARARRAGGKPAPRLPDVGCAVHGGRGRLVRRLVHAVRAGPAARPAGHAARRVALGFGAPGVGRRGLEARPPPRRRRRARRGRPAPPGVHQYGLRAGAGGQAAHQVGRPAAPLGWGPRAGGRPRAAPRLRVRGAAHGARRARRVGRSGAGAVRAGRARHAGVVRGARDVQGGEPGGAVPEVIPRPAVSPS